MIRDYYNWWITQLAECIPKQWREAVLARRNAIVVTPIGPIGPDLAAISIDIWNKNKKTPLGEYDATARELTNLPRPARLPVLLQLPDSQVLRKTITLPAATERDLAQVLTFEMDRETPFSVDEIFWTYKIVGRNKQRGQLTVCLRLITRASIVGLLEAFEQAGLPMKQAEIVGGPDDGASLPLTADGIPPKRAVGTRALRWAPAAICAALAVGVVAAPFVRQAWDFSIVDQEIRAGRAAATEADQLRRDIDRLEGAGNVIQSERAAAGDPLATLAALTAVLPDDTYLIELQQQQHKVTFGGRSAAASRLIGAVTEGHQLRNPTFAAPVTRMEASHTEVFTISAETGP